MTDVQQVEAMLSKWKTGYIDRHGRTVILRETTDGTKVVGDDIPAVDAVTIAAAYNALLQRIKELEAELANRDTILDGLAARRPQEDL